MPEEENVGSESMVVMKMTKEEFKEKLIPKTLEEKNLMIFKCPNKIIRQEEGDPIEEVCGNAHFRHSAYITVLLPFVIGDGEKKIQKDQEQVLVCTKCKSCYIWYNGQVYDVTDQVDLDAWRKLEREHDGPFGPGGNC